MRRLSIEFAGLRRILLRGPAVGAAHQIGFAEHADGARVPSPEGVRPYPGLAPFSELDADWFYGRDRLIALLVSGLNERLYGNTPLVVMGASGAGKSSVLRAGLLPELLNGGLTEPGSEDWPWMTMTPGRFPLRDLALRLADLAKIPSSQVLDQIESDPAKTSLIVHQGLLTRDERSRRGVVTTTPDFSGDRGTAISQRRLILIIDQFEEVFTECHDGQQRKLFIDSICAISSGTRYNPPPTLVVIGLHTAFIEQCTAHPELAPALDDSVIVGPMTSRELHEVIESPAHQAGLIVGPGLVETMLGDIGAVESRISENILTYDPGKLPLLAHALLETWKRRDGSQLTVAAYQAAGGIRHALADTAERLYESFDDVGKQVAKRLLLHMAAPGDAEDTRRTMSRTALLAELPDADQDIAAHLLDQLEEKRLVTADEDTVQIAHEALLRHWPRLADWLQEDRDWRREEQRLAEYTREWTNNARDPDRLLRGGALAAVQEKLDKRHRAGLGEIEKAFLVASEGREARRRRARRFIMVLLIVLTVVAGGFAEVAQHDRTLASRQQALAQSRQLAAEAAALRASNPGVSLLLSLEAYRVQPSYEAVSSLLSAQLGYFTTALDDQAGPANAVAYDPAAPLLAVAGQENAVTVWDTGSHRLALRLRGQSPFYAVAFNQAGNLLAGAEQDGVTIVWNMTTRQEAGVLGASGGPSVNAVTFDPRGQIIATAGNDETITLWSTRTMREIRTLNVGAIVNGIAISRDGTRLAAACSDHDVRVWNLAPGDIPPLVLSGHTDPVLAVAFSPDSALLASSSDDGTIRLWDSRTGAPRGVLSASTSPVDALAFSPGGTLLASGGANDAVRLWDVGTLTQVDALTGPASTVTGVAFSPSGQALTSVDTSATVGIWDVTTPPQPGSKPIAVITSTPRPGGTIATADDGEKIALWKPDGEASYAALRTPPSPAVSAGASGNATTDIALSPDGSTLAAARPGNQVTLWNTRTGHKLGTLTAPGALTSVAYRPVTGPAVIAAGSPDGYIYIWGPDASQPIQLAGDLQAPVTSVAFSPDGTLLAAGSDDGTFLLARHRSSGGWIALQPTGGPLNAVETVAFSPDGEMLATGSSTGTVQLWNITNPGDPVRLTTLTVSAQSVISVTFSDSGELAASYDDGTIRLWDIRNPASAVPLATLSGLASPTSVTWQTGSRAVSGATADGTLLTWDTEPSDIADRICDSRLSGNADDLIPYLTGVSYYPICPGE